MYVVSAPSTMPSLPTAIPRSSSSPHRSTTRSGGSPSSPVRATIRSVPPAIGRVRPSATASRASARLRGLTTGGSTGTGYPWLRAAMAMASTIFV